MLVAGMISRLPLALFIWVSANVAVFFSSPQYLTRFTDEIFSTLISAIFVVEAVSDVGRTFGSPASTFAKALLTLVCASTTYMLATTLKSLRRSVFFNKTIRNTISNFAPTIGVVTAALLARWARVTQGVAAAGLPSLSMPAVFGTTSGRPWLVPLLDLPVWARWASLLPALMATVLLFLDQNITGKSCVRLYEWNKCFPRQFISKVLYLTVSSPLCLTPVRLVNNAKYKMTKGRRENNVLDGMHLDMLVISLLTAVQSIFGIPWLVAATVRSLSHVNACTNYDSAGKATGTSEQRVTGVAIHALIGGCVLFSKPRQLLAQLPLPVLMGLFMYLGTSGLPGNEMWERILGLFKDKKVAPKERWSDKVPAKVTRMFTLTQVLLLGIMFWVKESQIGVLFPLIIAMLAPIRFGLERTGIVKKEYMDILDEE